MTRILRGALFALAVVGLLLVAYSWEPAAAAVQPAADRKPAPDFSLPDAGGAKVKLSSYKGKVVLLNFWATWCGPCKLEIPWFIEFEKKYKGQGFAVIGVSMDEDGWKVVKPYVARIEMNYRVLLGDEPVAKLYGGVDSLPATWIIDRSGKIAVAHTGLVSRSTYEEEIQALLRK